VTLTKSQVDFRGGAMSSRREFLARSAAGLAALGAPALARAADVPGTDFNKGFYLRDLIKARADVAADGRRGRSWLSQLSALCGDEAGALAEPAGPAKMERVASDLSKARAEDAVAAIRAAARGRRIVVLNEAHHVSRCRAFGAALMRGLREDGFDWFTAETFIPRYPGAPHVSDWRPGRPFLPGYGFYTRDPVLAETVREAGELGYRFADYEQRRDQWRLAADAPRDDQIAEREEAEANNLIANVLDRHPKARVLVYVGYSHAAKVPIGKGPPWFAARLKAKTGLDPLSVQQAFGWPALAPEADTAEVAAVLARFSPSGPIAVRRGDAPFLADIYAGAFDVAVYHPRLPDVDGRPGWLAADPKRKRAAFDLSGPTDGLSLAQAVREEEGEGAVPSDHYPLEPGATRAVFFLRPGRYRVRLETLDGYRPLGTLRV
jgi:hypothetical protein